MSTRNRMRLESALEGGVESPPVAGLSFVPPEALMGSGAHGSEDPAEVLAATVADLSLDFAFVAADADWAEDAQAGLTARGRGILWVVDGPLWPVLFDVGISKGLKATAWEPASLDERLDAETSRAQDQILRGSSLGVDAVVVTDDIAGSAGPIVAPDYFNEHLVERYALLVAIAASAGLRTVFHSDGDVRAFIPGLARAGFIALHGGGGTGPDGVERLLEAARTQGLSMLGGLDTASLREGPAAAVSIGTRAGVLASAGGLIVADDGGITTSEEISALTAAFGSAGVGR